MSPEDIAEVWRALDRDRLRALVARGPEPIFAIISGAHLYGFASPDSDIDLRGAFLLSCREILGLEPPVETLTIEEKTDVELDWVAHDVRKFARLLTRHNGYALEQLYSPLVVLGTDSFEELRELGRGCVTRPTVRHYRGFARGRRLRLREPDPTVKHLLYAYRVLLSGIHLMNTGEIEANILTLNDIFAIERVQELVERKREGAEKMSLSAEELSAHEAHLDSLERALDEAYETSALPMEPTTTRALEDFVIRLRLETLGGRS